MGRPPIGNEGIEARTIGLLPTHWKKLEMFGRKMGYGSISAALRRIVDEWWELRGRQLVTTDELKLMSPSVEVESE